MKKLLLSLAATTALVLAACGSTTGSSTSSSAGGTPASSKPAAPACTAPCAVKDGVTVTVSNLNRNVPPGEFDQPKAGVHVVSLMVAFKNDGDQEYNANSTSFVLKDPTGVKHQETFTTSEGCSSWQAVNLTKGAALAPQPLCFEANGDAAGPLTLVWTATLFAGDQNIALQ